MLRVLLIHTVVLGALVAAQAPGTPQAPPRDTPAQPSQKPAATPAARISGRVVSADTGRPVPRARVALGSQDGRGSRSAFTDAGGVFDLSALAAGRYTLSVSKSGFVGLSYGQRRPLLPGTPLQLGDGQHLAGIEFRLPRGSVISGHVYDEIGDPIPGTMVQVLRYQLQQGERQLTPAGGGQTDDRGQYRVWGLTPGEYFVSARPRPDLMVAVGAQAARIAEAATLGRGGRGGRAGGPAGRALMALGATENLDNVTAYAPSYYPGVASVTEARPITLGLSAEVLDVNFNVVLVRTATISGRVTNPDGASSRGGAVTLFPDTGTGGARGPAGGAFNARFGADGLFSVANVPPGQYVLRARSDGGPGPGNRGGGPGGAPAGPGGRRQNQPASTQFFGTQSIAVAGEDVADVLIALSAGSTISGLIALEGAAASSAQPVTAFRVVATPVSAGNFGAPNPPQTDADGHFTISNVPAGLHWLRAQAPRGWALKSLTAGARDVVDAPLEIRSGEDVTGLVAVFTDRLTEVKGTIVNDRGTPVPDYTVLAFTTDSNLWRPQSRYIVVTRPDQNGAFQLRGLPPGDYYLAVIDPVEQGEWFDPVFLDAQRPAAARVRLDEGAVRTHEFKVR